MGASGSAAPAVAVLGLEAAALGSANYPRPEAAPEIGYGTAGFRTAADVLDNVMYRMGILAALRSKALDGKSVGVMITASHNPERDNGVKLVEPMGEMLPQEWEAHATKLANTPDDRLAIVLEELVKLLGIDLNINAIVVVGRDTRSSSVRLALALCDGAGALRPSLVRSIGVVTTPQLHYVVRCQTDPTFGSPSVLGYQDKLMRAFKELFSIATTKPVLYKPEIKVDCACGVGALALSTMVARAKEAGLSITLVNLNSSEPGKLNEGCGADFVKIQQTAPAGATLSAGDRWVSLDGDADRAVYFYSREQAFCLLDGDRIALLLASYMQKLIAQTGVAGIRLGLVQTAYANGASTTAAKQLLGEDQIVFAKTGVKHCHHAALDFDVGIYFEANGHGTVIFSAAFVQAVGYVASGEGTYQSMATLREARNSAGQLLLFRDLINEAVGDAISNFLAVEAILRLLDWDADKWRDMYDDLPNRQIKVVVSDRSIFETTDAERICVKPEGLQAQIDELVQKVPKGRSFVRPSGTEDCVRVYVEAETLQATLELGQAVVDLVYAKAGGVGNKPVVA